MADKVIALLIVMHYALRGAKMQFVLNGHTKEFSGDPSLPLLSYLREHENILSVKNGCAPQAACGACTVDFNGKAVLSCVIPMKKVDSGTVTTIEGLGEYRRGVYANAFITKGAVQCGFCTPGIVIRANALINRNPNPSYADTEMALTPHLCRCTGYKKVVEAILMSAQAIRAEEEIPLPSGDGQIGSRHPKYGGRELVLGRHRYTDDVRIEGMKHGALKFSAHPRAKVNSIDTHLVEQLDGVLGVFTAADVPGERFIGLIEDDWPLMVAEGEITRYVGDVIVSVVAESEALAREAIELIDVEYEILEPVTDMHRALDADAPRIHERGNLHSHTVIRRGDLERAMAESAFIVQGEYETQRIEHGYLEPECAVCYPEGEGLRLLSQGQGIFSDRELIALLLDLPEMQLRVTQFPTGGAFGGKEDLSVQGHAALMAYHLSAPVKVRLNRDESIRMSTKRHPIWMEYQLGCDAEGKFTFVNAKFVGDTGAYGSVGSKVLERSAGHATGAYHFPVAAVDARAVYTNNIPAGAMRGFGANQATFGIESLIDKLCEVGGFDRWQFRYDNALVNGSMTATGQVIKGGVGIRATLRAVKDQFYKAKFAGLACAIKNTGIGNAMVEESKVRITVHSADRVVVDHGWTEMGQGVNTIAQQVVCSETGLLPEIIVVQSDTLSGQLAGMTTASRASSLMGNALIEACKRLKADLLNQSLDKLVGREYTGSWRVDWTTKPGDEVEEVLTHFAYSYATQLVILDEEDGSVRKAVAAHDAGKILNPSLFEGQVEGAIHMGIGYALSEDFPMHEGQPISTHLRKLGILRAKEMPEVEVIGVEVPDPIGPYGAKGVGEIGLLPTAPAVANALYQYDGVRRSRLPMRA
jgi:xanthine dehydrogenase molybdenum-binding subunit